MRCLRVAERNRAADRARRCAVIVRGLIGSVLAVYVFSWARFDGPSPVLIGLKALCVDVVSSAGLLVDTWHW